MQQVGPDAGDVVAHDVGDHGRDRRAQRGAVGGDGVGEVDRADAGQHGGGRRALQPHQRAAVGEVEDRRELAGAGQALLEGGAQRGGRTRRAEREPLPGGGPDEQHRSGPDVGAQRAPEPHAQGLAARAVERGADEHLRERGLVRERGGAGGRPRADLPAVEDGGGGGGDRAARQRDGPAVRVRHAGALLRGRRGRGSVTSATTSRPSGRRTVTRVPTAASSRSSCARPIERPSVGDIRLDVTRPAMPPAPVEDLAGLRGHDRPVERAQADQARVGVAAVLPHQLRLADEVRLVELDQLVDTGAEALGQAVGVLPDDRVALLEAQDALRLDAEGAHAEVLAGGHQLLPHVQAVRGRHVDLEGQLAGEPDPPEHAVGDAGHGAGADAHVAEGLGPRSTIGEPAEQLARAGPGDVDAGVGGGHRGDVHLPLRARGLQPALHPLPHRGGARGRRRHEVVLLAEPSGDAVVEHHAVLGAHDPVAHPADAELLPLVDVEQLEQLRHVRPAEVELADRGDVDEPDRGAHGRHLGGGVAVVVGTDPLAGDQRDRAVALVPRLHRRVPHGLARPAGERAEGHRRVHRPPRGGARRGDRAAGGLGEDRDGVDRLELALRRAPWWRWCSA